MLQTALEMIKKNPTIGVGIGNYGYLYNYYRPLKSIKRAYVAKAHNAYLEIIAEIGIFGFVVFIGFLLYVLIMSIASIRKAKGDLKVLAVGFFGCFSALLVNGLSFGIFAHNYTWVLFALLLSTLRIKGNLPKI